MKRELLDHLRCPYCKSKLTLTSHKKQGTEILEGTLKCKCLRSYPLIKGVPQLLGEDLIAFILKNYKSHNKEFRNAHDSKIKTMLSFGTEWKEFSEMHKDYYAQFLDWVKPLDKNFFRGKMILDAGCGTGCHTLIMDNLGGKVIGIDFSEAVDMAYKKNKELHNSYIVQADLLLLPLKKEFDFVFCNGVLHHLPLPKQGLTSLLSVLKHKGLIYIKVYSKEGNFLTILLIEKILKKIVGWLPHSIRNALCWFFAHLLNFMIFTVYLPVNKLTEKHVLPFQDYFVYISKFSFRHKQNIVYDVLSAPEVHYFSENELKTLLNKMKILNMTGKDVLSWRVLAQKIK